MQFKTSQLNERDWDVSKAIITRRILLAQASAFLATVSAARCAYSGIGKAEVRQLNSVRLTWQIHVVKLLSA